MANYSGIELKLVDGVWMATHTGEAAQDVYEACGTVTIQTAFTRATPAARVLEKIQALNPGVDVFLADVV